MRSFRFFTARMFGVVVDADVTGVGKVGVKVRASKCGMSWTETVPFGAVVYKPRADGTWDERGVVLTREVLSAA